MARHTYGASKETYATRLAGRMKAKRATDKSRRDLGATGSDAPTVTTLEGAHPGRYPKHSDPEKGQVYGGECNTTLCERRRAVFFNRGTYGLYCPDCARGQNGRDPVPISVPVDEKPSIDRMNAMNREMMDAMSELRRA